MVHHFQRILGKSGIKVSALGMGCWAIGGPMSFQGIPLGWSTVDDKESKLALKAAFEMGINFFDTADMYGMGHSEKLIGEELSAYRDELVISTKFGATFNNNEITGFNGTPEYARQALEDSLKRLKVDYIDIYNFHIADYDLKEALKTRDELEKMVDQGLIKGYSWSTDKTENAALFAEGPNCMAIQQELNIFVGNMDIIQLCEEKKMASINRGPLAMGLLTGKYNQDSQFKKDDCRIMVDKHGDPYYMFFKDGKPNMEFLQQLEHVKEILCSEGRSLAQGALAWIWAKSNNTVPIPGFKTVKQVEENVKALDYGPLKPEQMKEIEDLLTLER